MRLLISTQHAEDYHVDAHEADLIDHVLEPVLPADLYDPARLRSGDFVLVNPTGSS